MSAFEQELYDDLGYEDAEGMSDLYDEDLEMDEMDDYDEDESEEDFEDEDEYEESAYFEDDFDEFDELSEYDEYDEFDEGDEFEDEDEEALDNVMAYALDSEDTDEFIRKWAKKAFRGAKKLAKGAVRVARKAAPVIGKIGRIAAPILSKLPFPQAQLAARIAKLAGRLRAEGATDEEILDAVAEVATKDKRALPIVAGLTAKTILKGRGRTMSFGARKKVVKDMKNAAKVLVRKRGPKAVRALPKIAKSVKRATARKGTPAMAKATIVKRSAIKVAKSPTLTRKLAKPSMKAKIAAKKVVKARSYTMPGPTKITITAV